MTALVPNRFLFDFEIPLPYLDRAPALEGRLQGWTDRERLPALWEIDGQRGFSTIWAGWNEQGLYLGCEVRGKRKRPACDPERYWESDVLRVCVNMRPAPNLRRATRFCRQFFFMPTGGSKRPALTGKESKGRFAAPRNPGGPDREHTRSGGRSPAEAVAGCAPFQRAKEAAAETDPRELHVAAQVHPEGYVLEARVGAGALPGFDPVEHPRIGFYVMVEDLELGQQYLTVGDALLWYVDPSTWVTARLERS